MMNIAHLLELCNNVLNNTNINIHIFLNAIHNKNIINNDNIIYYPLIKNAVLKLSEKHISNEFIKIYHLYEKDNDGYNQIVMIQHAFDNNIFMNNRYYLSEYFIKSSNKSLLEYILNKHDVFLNLYLLKAIINKIYTYKSNDDCSTLSVYNKFFNDLDENYRLIYFYALINENNQHINYIKYINIVYDKLKNEFTYEENIDIFRKIIAGKYYDIIVNIILKIKKDFKINLIILSELINGFYFDQFKVDIIIKNFEMEITEQLIILLIKYKYSVNKDTKINNNILKECANNNFYPYKIDFIPDNNIMEIESKKINNLTKFKSFHILGSTITIGHLKNACGIKYNEEIIKYIVENGIIPDEECLLIFKNVYKNTIINNFLDNYFGKNLLINNNYKLETINEKNLFFIEKKNIKNTCSGKEYEEKHIINSKILKFFNIEKEKSLNELKEIFLNYLITNNLIISHYFIIDEGLSLLFDNINKSTMMNINEIDNIISYFIKN